MSQPPKTPKEAARLAEKRAREAQAKFQTDSAPKEFTSEEVLTALKDNEMGDARLLLAVMRDRFVFDAKREAFYRFANGYWTKDIEKEALAEAGRILNHAYGQEAARQDAIATDPLTVEEAKKIAVFWRDKLNRRRDKVNSLHRQQSVLKLAATGLEGLVINGDQWNAGPWTIQAQDQLIDLKTGESRLGLPGDFVNKAAPTGWKGLQEPAPQWEDFLSSVFDGNEELINYVHRVLGAALIGTPNTQEFFIFWGEGRNGKGTILETLKEVLGESLAGPLKSEMIMENRQSGGGGANPELLNLQGRRIAWVSESGENKRLNTEKVKLLTGGDTLSGRLNYSNDIISFKPTHTLFLLTNHRPKISGTDVATWDRLRLIPFTQRFVSNPAKDNEHPQDKDLQGKLLQEASGILAWLVRGCIASQQPDGLTPPAIVSAAGEEYRLDEDFLRQFVNERCIQGKGYKVQSQPIQDAFKTWFGENFGEKAKPPAPAIVSRWLRNSGFQREQGTRHAFFHGIALKDDER